MMAGCMSTLTALWSASFVGYGGAWYMGMVEGNFSLLLFLAAVVTGVYWLAEKFYFWPQRRKAAELVEREAGLRHAELAAQGFGQVDGNLEEARARVIMQPWW